MHSLTDDQLDQEYKLILKDRRNGQYLPLDIVAHLEYFYNTLRMGHNLENPFVNPNQYPALLFEENISPGTLLERHRKIIFPASEISDGCDSKLSVSSPSKYKWYPNPLLDSPSSPMLESPMPSQSEKQ